MTDPKGENRDCWVMLTNLAPFNRDLNEGWVFMKAFLLRANRYSDEQRRYWFRQLACSSCFSWFQSKRWPSWSKMKATFLSSFKVHYKKGETLNQEDSPP